MLKLKENDQPWRNGYAFACIKNTVSTPYLSFRKQTKAGIYLQKIKKENDYTVLPALISEILFSFRLRSFFKNCILVPLPPSKERDLQPVYVIADEIGKRTGVPVMKDLLSVVMIDTLSVIDKSVENKTRNYNFHFIPSDEVLAGIDKNQRLVLFDDYYDTSKTLRDAVFSLNELGYYNIDIFTVCCTQRAKKRILGKQSFS